MFFVDKLQYSLSSFIVLLIVITVSLLVIHFLYNASMILDKKEFKFLKGKRNEAENNIKQKKKEKDNL